MLQDTNKNANKNANNRTKHEHETNYKERGIRIIGCPKIMMKMMMVIKDKIDVEGK